MTLASKTPDSTDPRDAAFIREVDEAYRADTMKAFASRYGLWIGLALALLLIGVAGWLWWQSYHRQQQESVAERFSLAMVKLESGAPNEAMPLLDQVAAEGNDSYQALAALTKGGVAAANGDNDAAVKALQAVAGSQSAPAALKDAAVIKRLRLEFDRMEPAEVLKNVQPYLTESNEWFPVAAELAALAHLKAGAPDKAGPLFLQIAKDREAPQSLRSRAEQMAASLGQDVPDLTVDVEQPVEMAAK